ncbi:hypothetical protein DPEC_G00344750 [Dallia pectoralis]|uniref:Uncharacterized protein n=1 Tax=Dallia pectoralis TaxID=75939 RepID=A0ACC2F3G9_DALPE|nr:hypothetical protein DPEC_G00344750 [Dallia pectoralis]
MASRPRVRYYEAGATVSSKLSGGLAFLIQMGTTRSRRIPEARDNQRSRLAFPRGKGAGGVKAEQDTSFQLWPGSRCPPLACVPYAPNPPLRTESQDCVARPLERVLGGLRRCQSAVPGRRGGGLGGRRPNGEVAAGSALDRGSRLRSRFERILYLCEGGRRGVDRELEHLREPVHFLSAGDCLRHLGRRDTHDNRLTTSPLKSRTVRRVQPQPVSRRRRTSKCRPS